MTSLFFLYRFTACLSSRVPAFVLNFKVAMCLCAGNNRDSATGLTFVLSTGVEFRFNHKRSGNIDRRVLQSWFFTYFSNWVSPQKQHNLSGVSRFKIATSAQAWKPSRTCTIHPPSCFTSHLSHLWTSCPAEHSSLLWLARAAPTFFPRLKSALKLFHWARR